MLLLDTQVHNHSNDLVASGSFQGEIGFKRKERHSRNINSEGKGFGLGTKNYGTRAVTVDSSESDST